MTPSIPDAVVAAITSVLRDTGRDGRAGGDQRPGGLGDHAPFSIALGVSSAAPGARWAPPP